MGVFQALCAVCACALMQVLLLPIGRGFTRGLEAWQEVKGEAMSVNEALYAGVIEGTVRPDGS